MTTYYRIYTAKAPVNIAVIKYWGKSNEALKIPINDSLSGTLNVDDMCATTSVAISSSFEADELWLNGTKQNLDDKSQAKVLIDEMRKRSTLDREIVNLKIHIVSHNNFPTAAGLASSAAGYSCLAFVLGQVYSITDPIELSTLARRGSGSACRSLYGGFVHWEKGDDDATSKALQIADHKHWPEMRVVICVINDQEKDVSSSKGMLRSVQTSQLLQHRANEIVPARISEIKDAIRRRDFEMFANITMRDSNQFHAICLDTFPPIFYLSEASRQIIKICTAINTIYGHNKVAYTFDAGPNACIYVLDNFVDQFISVINHYFPAVASDGSIGKLIVKGAEVSESKFDAVDLEMIYRGVDGFGVEAKSNSLRYLINTSIGDGPRLVDEHLDHNVLKL